MLKEINSENFLTVLIRAIYAIILVTILFVCFFFALSYYLCARLYPGNIFLAVLGLCLVLLIYCIFMKIPVKSFTIQKKKMILLLLSAGFLIIQICMAHQYYFRTGWDPYLIYNAASAAANGSGSAAETLDYFSMYPNNTFLVFLFSIVIKLMHIAGMQSYDYFGLIVFQSLICWLTGVLLFSAVVKIRDSYRLAAVTYCVYILLVGLSPWVTIPYSDATALIFPVLIINIYLWNTKSVKHEAVKWFCIALTSYIGFRIKPQVLIPTIAIVLYSAMTAITKTKEMRQCWQRICTSAAGFAVGALTAILLVSSAVDSLDYTLDSSKEFGLSHYFMMGMNEETQGTWSAGDVAFSSQFKDTKTRSEANWHEGFSRLRAMGLTGFSRLIEKKILINFNDGTFFWSGEGSFYYEVSEVKNEFISPLLRNVYYTGDQPGECYMIWSNAMQALWLAVLLLSIGCCLRRPENKAISVIMLSMIGLTIYELIFEARARYLFDYVPLYIILAVNGLDSLHALVIKKIKFREKKKKK